MAEQTQAFASFFDGYRQEGVSSDGLPHFVSTLMITVSVPPYTMQTREADNEDIETYPEAYRLYEKQRKALEVTQQEGFPLVLWPAASQAAIQMLSAREIYTVEQLAKLGDKTGKGKDTMPGELRELAQRAKAMIELSAELGQFEVKLRERDGEIAALKEQVDELRSTIKAQDGMLGALKARVAA